PRISTVLLVSMGRTDLPVPMHAVRLLGCTTSLHPNDEDDCERDSDVGHQTSDLHGRSTDNVQFIRTGSIRQRQGPSDPQKVRTDDKEKEIGSSPLSNHAVS